MSADSRLTALLEHAERVLVFTGAGISTGSGIADYRGPQGVWTRRRPVMYQDFLRSHEARVEYWEGKLEAWPSFHAARPNPAHRALVTLEHQGKLLLLATQNIDGLHEAAGTSPERLLELHGTNAWIECVACGDRSDPAPHFRAFAETREPPQCPWCGGFLKPATISFGQALRPGDMDRAFRAAAACDLVLALGSTLSVTPAAHVPLAGADDGSPYVIINQGPTEHDQHPAVTLRLEGDVVDLLQVPDPGES